MECETTSANTEALGSPVQFIERSSDQALIDHQVRLELKSAYPVIRATTTKQLLECLVSIKSEGHTSAKNEFLRYNNVDLICVIDVSGSMSGAKIDLVRKSLNYVLAKLNSKDRLAIIKFATKATVLCEFTSASESAKLSCIINNLQAEDSTNIKAGLELAYNMVRDNLKSSNLQCVLLLSDGRDMEGFTPEGVVVQLENYFGTSRPPFTIHSLGYGSDHDPKIMKKAAKLQGGKFRFVEKDQDLDIVVAKLLGGLFSTIAKRITVRIGINPSFPLQGGRIIKVYGDSVIADPSGDYIIPIVQYRAGSTNSYAIELEVPSYDPLNDKIQLNRSLPVLQASAQIEQLDSSLESVRLESKLEVNILHPNEILKKAAPEEEVLEYHSRGAVLEIIKACARLMEEGNSGEAKTELQRAHEILNRAPATDKIRQLRQDVNQMIEKATQRDYRGGHRFMTQRDAFYGDCEEDNWGESMMCYDIQVVRHNERRRK